MIDETHSIHSASPEVLTDQLHYPSLEALREDPELFRLLARGTWRSLSVQAQRGGATPLVVTLEHADPAEPPLLGPPTSQRGSPPIDTTTTLRPLRPRDRVLVFHDPVAGRGAEGYAFVTEILGIDTGTGLTRALVDFNGDVYRPVPRLLAPDHRVLEPAEQPSSPW